MKIQKFEILSHAVQKFSIWERIAAIFIGRKLVPVHSYCVRFETPTPLPMGAVVSINDTRFIVMTSNALFGGYENKAHNSLYREISGAGATDLKILCSPWEGGKGYEGDGNIEDCPTIEP